MRDPAVLQEAPPRYPLSTQQMMCCEDENISGPQFTIPFGLRISGQLDLDALQGALNDLVARHEVLRTTIDCDCEDGGAPYQTVLPAEPVPFTVHEVALDPGRSRDEVAEEILVELYSQRIDRNDLPLLRATLHRFDDRDAVLTLLTHHSAGDGWSCNVIRRDLAICYRARTSGLAPQLPEVRQYREFGAWQQELLHGERAATHRGFWRNKLAGTGVYTMPSDRRNGEGVLKSPDRTANFVIEPEEFAAVEARALDIRSSAWHAILAAGTLLAHKLRGGSDITLMTNVSGRIDPSFHNTVGFCADFVPMRMDLDGCTTYADVLARARSTCLEAYRHLLPITAIEEGMTEFVAPYDDPESVPFIFNYTRPVITPDEMQFADGVELMTLTKEEPGDRGGWCIWSMWRMSSGALRGVIEYPPDLVDPSTVEGWVADFLHLLSQITHAPDQNWKGQ